MATIHTLSLNNADLTKVEKFTGQVPRTGETVIYLIDGERHFSQVERVQWTISPAGDSIAEIFVSRPALYFKG